MKSEKSEIYTENKFTLTQKKYVLYFRKKVDLNLMIQWQTRRLNRTETGGSNAGFPCSTM